MLTELSKESFRILLQKYPKHILLQFKAKGAEWMVGLLSKAPNFSQAQDFRDNREEAIAFIQELFATTLDN